MCKSCFIPPVPFVVAVLSLISFWLLGKSGLISFNNPPRLHLFSKRIKWFWIRLSRIRKTVNKKEKHVDHVSCEQENINANSNNVHVQPEVNAIYQELIEFHERLNYDELCWNHMSVLFLKFKLKKYHHKMSCTTSVPIKISQS